MRAQVENVSALLREMIAQLTTEAAALRARARAAAAALGAARERLAPPDRRRIELVADVRAPLAALQHCHEVTLPPRGPHAGVAQRCGIIRVHKTI